MSFGRLALATGCLDAAAASQTRTLIAIGASQVAGARAAVAELRAPRSRPGARRPAGH